MSEPVRPATVPPEAVWSPTDNEWELGRKNAAGKHAGTWRWWLAPRGHLVCETLFDEEGAMVKATRFHPNGEVSRALDVAAGTDVYYRSTEPTTESFAYGTEPPTVWRAEKRGGYPIRFAYYDREGRHLNPEIVAAKLVSNAPPRDPEAVRAQLAKGQRSGFGEDFAARVLALVGDAGATTPLLEAELRSLDDGETLYHEGDLELSDLADWDALGLARLIVHGNLNVRGSVRLTDDPFTLLVVTGGLRAANVITSGGLVVLGDLEVASCLLGDYNHGSTFIGGAVRARLFHPEEYFFEVVGDSVFEIAFGNSYRLNEDTRPEAMTFNERTVRDVIARLDPAVRQQLALDVDAYLDDPPTSLWRYIDRHAFMRYCASGAPVLA